MAEIHSDGIYRPNISYGEIRSLPPASGTRPLVKLMWGGGGGGEYDDDGAGIGDRGSRRGEEGEEGEGKKKMTGLNVRLS